MPGGESEVRSCDTIGSNFGIHGATKTVKTSINMFLFGGFGSLRAHQRPKSGIEIAKLCAPPDQAVPSERHIAFLNGSAPRCTNLPWNSGRVSRHAPSYGCPRSRSRRAIDSDRRARVLYGA